MKLSTKKLSILVLSLVLAMCAFLGLTYKPNDAFAEKQVMPVTGIFSPSNMEISPCQIPGGMSSLTAGCLLTADAMGESASLKSSYIGKFSYVFEAVPQQGTVNLVDFDTVFTDVSGRSFTLRTSYSNQNYASVIFDGVQAGISYPINSIRYNSTKYANSNGVYTPFANGEVSVVFDAENMTVSVGAPDAESVVWDLSTAVNDGYDVGVTLDSFTEFTVDFVISKYKGDYSSALLRKINQCSLDGLLIEKTGAPSISVIFESNAICGNSYVLPEAVATDIWDGSLDVDCKVYSPKGKLIGQNISQFIPKEQGDYTIEYFTQNSRGETCAKTYTVKAFAQDDIPEYTISLDAQSLQIEKAFVGESVYVPVMTLSEGISLKGSVVAKLTVKYNGIVVGYYNNIPGGFDYEFKKDGVYEFCYDAGFGKVKTYTIQVETPTVYLDANLKESYLLGDVVDLRSAKMVVGVTAYDCDITVEYPSGENYQNAIFECKKVGKYTVKANCKVNDEVYEEIKIFEVCNSVESLFESVSSNVTSVYGNSIFTNKPGVLLNFGGGRLSATYKNAIDISKYRNQRKLNENGTYAASDNAIPLITWSVEPFGYGVAGMGEFYINLTDAQNPDNVLSIVLDDTDSKVWTYIRAKAGDQDYVGFNNNDSGATLFNGQKGNFYTSGRYGFGQPSSFYGDVSLFGPERQILTLYYDVVEKQILAKPTSNADTLNWIVCDLDDPACCNGTPWAGFSGDKVYLSVQSGALKNSSAGVAIYGVDGISFDSSKLVYDEKPTIKVESERVTGLKGYNLKVPTASAFDKYGEKVDVLAKAYYISNDNYYDVKIKDGKFLIANSGTYKVVFTAQDAFGNISSEEVIVEVLDSISDANISYRTAIADEFTVGKAGSVIKIYNDLLLENVIGQVETLTSISFNGQEIEIQDGSFIPKKAGTYTVSHKVVDDLGRISNQISYEIEVEYEVNPITLDGAPAYYGFIRGNTYQLIDVNAIDFSVSETPIKADVYVNGVLDDDGKFFAEKVIEEKDSSEHVENVTIEYKIGDKVVYFDGQPLSYNVPIKTIYKTMDIKITPTISREVTAYMLDRYFTTQNMAIEKGNYLNFKPLEDGATTTLLQPIASRNLSIKFDIADKKNSSLSAIEPTTSKVSFAIIDQLNSSKQVVVDFVLENNKTEIYVNGVKANSISTLSGFLLGAIGTEMEVKYDARNKVLTELNSRVEIAQLSTFSDGSDFTGFSENVYLSMSVSSAEGMQSNGVQLININSQVFTGQVRYDDDYAPFIVLNGNVGGTFIVGEKCVIPSAIAYDVLSDVNKDSLTVSVSLDGVPVKDVNGVTLNNVSATKEYEIELSVAGKYVVTYNVQDMRGGKMIPKDYVITVRINSDPIISKVEIQSTVKKGSKIKVPTPKVQFAVESEENTFYVVYVAPDNTYQWLNKGDEIVAKKTGTYKIRYMAIDAYGNSAYAEYKVVCHD